MDIGSILGTSPTVPQAPAVEMPAAAPLTPTVAPSAADLLTPSATPAAVPTVPQVTHRSFGDSVGTRKAIYDSVLNAARAFAPATNNQYTLGLQNVDYDGRDNFTKAEQKKAILSGATLGRSLRGDWVLTDPTGAEVSRKRALLARVPHMTERGTFIVNGSEYSLANQLRLRPGIYTRQQENGEIEAHVNVKSGRAHKLFLDPATGIFRIKIGQARIPLLPLLKTMGVTDKQIRENWGDLAAVNQQKSDPQALKKLYERVRSTGTETDPEAQSKSVAEAFLQMELDPDVTKRTLGQAFTRVGPDSILATTKKLLAVSRGEQEPDDRDSMAYQSLMGPEDLFAERIQKAKNIARNLLWKSTARRGIDHIPAGVLTNALQSTLTMSGLGQALEEINTAEILDHQSRVTRRGEGGIQDASAIPLESRSVNPSQLGLIDYLRTPDSLSAGIDVRLARNAMKGSDGRLYTKVINAKSGLTETRSANDIADGTLAFSGELQSGKQYVNVLQDGKIRTVPRENVDYELPDTESSFSPLGNMIPFKSSVKGQRSVMGSRFLTQALPLENAEAPYVQSGIPGQVDRSFEQEYGSHMGALRSPQGGVVTKVTPEAVEVRYEDGTKETHELYVNQPLNRKSVVGSTVVYIKRDGVLLRTRIDCYEWRSGDTTLSIDPATKKSAWLPVTGYTKHENDKQLLQIRLSSGRSVVVTEDHSLMVMGEAGHLVPAFPQDLKIDRTRLPVAMLPLEASQSMPKDLGVLIGLYLAEGHCPPSQPGLIMLSVKPPDRIAEIRVLLQRMGHVPQPSHAGGCVNFTSHEMCEFLVENFGHLSGNKRIPDWVFQTTREFRWSILSGYMAGDGNLWADHNGSLQVTGVSTSVSLRDGLVELAATLGIFCTIFDAPRQCLNANWNDAYGFRLTSQDLLLSLTDVPLFFYSDREAKFRAILKPAYRPSTFTAVPVANTRTARKLLYAGFSRAPAYVHKVAAAEGAVTANKLAASTGVFGKWGRSDVRWDKVVAIEPVPHQNWVYDLSVADSECFAVDHGLIVHNTFIHQTPTVRPGQTFKQGDLLARSNYTDHEGTTALGMNARVAYLPDEGYNYEDAISISESFARRMRSQHAYQHQHEWEPGDHQGKKAFISMFPSQYTKKQLDKFDDSGVVKQGETLHFGDPMILIASERERNKKSLVRSRTSFSDKSITWEHHSPGIVTDVVQTAKGPAVVVKAYAEMQAADKLAGRVGDKGIISRIIPDDQMPVGEDGKPMEVLLNPLGLTSRTNPMQMLEAALGKIAAKTGKPFRMPDFQNQDDLTEFGLAQLKEHGMSPTEVLTLADGRKVKGVPVGNRWFMKLHHMSDDKLQGRGLGSYDAEGAPAKGGQDGGKAKRVGMLEQNALLSHGALAVMNEDMRVKGQSSPEYWARYMSGYKPETPKVPFVYNKFVNQLRASGINVVRQGERSHIMAMTNKSVDELVGGRELKNAETVNWKNMEPMRGGLFDPTLTGGHGGTAGGGNMWSFIRLHQPLPNPVMEEPIRHILGLTQKKLQDVIGGKEQLNGKTGAAAIGAALANINLPRALENARADIKSGKKTLRDKAVRRLGYLKTCERLGTHPKDWMLDKVPVLPPAFRPVSVMGAKKLPLVADPNYLYKDLFQLNQMHKELADQLDPDALGDEQAAVYNAFKAVTGLGDPVGIKNQERGVKGILKSVFGSSPKYGVMNRKLLSSTVDMVGRGVIAPDPNLTLDETGIPETAAWEVFGPSVVRRMVRAGVSRQKAVQSVKDQLPAAKQYLQKEMDEGVVILSRAPTLHRYGTMAFRPKLIKGAAIKMNPLVNKGFGADYDGDQMNFRALTTDDAKQEALQKMLPSVNLFSTANFKADMNIPSQEYVAGLYQASKNSDTESPPAVFATAADAIRAFRSGKLGFDRRVQILES